MESLSDEIWDVVIAGTSIPQSLLALSLSRSGKKVLHVDRHTYYGGRDASLSLQEAETWMEDLDKFPNSVFNNASISRPISESAESSALKSSRSYTLSLNPQIVYAQSKILPSLVSSRIHTQLEFLAVGSWWVHRAGSLHKIPSTREDVFNDESLSMKDKRGLMKFLRFVLQEEEDESNIMSEDDKNLTLQSALNTKFKVPATLQAPLLALALSPVPASHIPFNLAVSRIRKHMRSMGYFGPGFGAVIAKYGGNSEISQVACRAGAVGGGVYLLGHDLTALAVGEPDTSGDVLLEGTLSNSTKIKARFVAGSCETLPSFARSTQSTEPTEKTFRSINIVNNSFRNLFPQTSDNGPLPAAAIVLVDDGDQLGVGSEKSPVYLQIHSEDTGECPPGQCIVYASVRVEGDETFSKRRLESAIQSLLDTEDASGTLLWTLSYVLSGLATTSDQAPSLLRPSSSVMIFPPDSQDIAFSDNVLDVVKGAWQSVEGPQADDASFLRFEERENEDEE
ncbi:Rab proteins geranylgeranyltransferase component A [Knufia peltigerae]|uniref:Rab proteins geranylgeranyltransferase n=1 Tax=Knufia peltigerae TaxID=1002370 RepID=A0AA38XWX6_9EURO|nr:Rab proteins geranylgeranyltransferase component A [Knufia peltigerae]